MWVKYSIICAIVGILGCEAGSEEDYDAGDPTCEAARAHLEYMECFDVVGIGSSWAKEDPLGDEDIWVDYCESDGDECEGCLIGCAMASMDCHAAEQCTAVRQYR